MKRDLSNPLASTFPTKGKGNPKKKDAKKTKKTEYSAAVERMEVQKKALESRLNTSLKDLNIANTPHSSYKHRSLRNSTLKDLSKVKKQIASSNTNPRKQIGHKPTEL